MPRQKSLLTVIRELVRMEVSEAFQAILGGLTGSKAKNGRRGKRRGPGRPPGSKNKKTRRRPGRPRSSKSKPV